MRRDPIDAFFTCDEIKIDESSVYLIEGKHTVTNSLPSSGDIKDGLLKMILFTNLENVKIAEKDYNPIPILKLTTGTGFNISSLNNSQNEMLNLLKKEAESNGFRVLIWIKG